MGKYKRKKQAAQAEQIKPEETAAEETSPEEPKSNPDEVVSTKEILDVYEELDRLKAEHPDIVAEVAPHLAKKNTMERLMEFYLKMRERFHIETRVNKKTYCRLCILGMFGVHQFYSRHWIKGILYICTSWCGISAGMTALDWIAAFPREADEDGMIVV